MRYRISKYYGYVLAVAGLMLLTYVYSPILKAEAIYYFEKSGIEYPETEEELVPASRKFSLQIPSLGVNRRIYENINLRDPEEYRKVLGKGVAHAKESVLPGNRGNILIFAHADDSPLGIANYNPEFYLLRKLKPGDLIILYFQGEKYYYRVSEKIVVAPEDVLRQTYFVEEESLTVQISWPPGTTIDRLLVFAQREAS